MAHKYAYVPMRSTRPVVSARKTTYVGPGGARAASRPHELRSLRGRRRPGGGSGQPYPSVLLIGGLTLKSGTGTTPPFNTDTRYRPRIAVGGAGGSQNPDSLATVGGPGRVSAVIAKP